MLAAGTGMNNGGTRVKTAPNAEDAARTANLVNTVGGIQALLRTTQENADLLNEISEMNLDRGSEYSQPRFDNQLSFSVSAPDLRLFGVQSPHSSQCNKEEIQSTAASKDQFFRTKLCIPFASGHCRRGKNCW